LTGDKGVSVLPSRLGASSLLDRFGMRILSAVAALSVLALAMIFTIGVPSAGLLKLRRTLARFVASSAVVVAARFALKALTVTGITDRFGSAGFAIVGRFWPLEAVDFEAARVDMEDAFDDCGPCD
jgi:hypothetical protein